MSVKAAVQSEGLPFFKEEIAEVQALAKAYVNMEVFKWYDRTSGPSEKHEHKRQALNTAVKQSTGGPSRGMGKVLADRIAAHQRLLNARNETRLQNYVRSEVRATQVELALTNVRDMVLRRVTV